tara:strand:+ start:1136 stop:1492 length:357 start_codon:yes stop_codon:yes gene_type:complete
MSCGCNKKRKEAFQNLPNISVKNLVEKLKSGLCVITIYRVNDTKPRDIYCTLQNDVTPSKGSSLHRTLVTEKKVNDNGFLMVWTTNKNLDKDQKPEAGWLKIKVDQILSYKFIENISS